MVIWHEQIIAILSRMTGCDRAAGDVARRALADKDRLPGVEAWFRRAAGRSGRYSPAVIDEVWSVVAEFGAYGVLTELTPLFMQVSWCSASFPPCRLKDVPEETCATSFCPR